MSQKQSALVVVSKDWIDTAVRFLINHGQQSRSAPGATHLIIADLEGADDPRGLWLKNVKTNSLKEDGATVTMRFMIPWTFVVGLGVVDHGAQMEPGFTAGISFDLSDVTDQAEQAAAR